MYRQQASDDRSSIVLMPSSSAISATHIYGEILGQGYQFRTAWNCSRSGRGLFVSNTFVNGIRYRLKWSYFQRRISCKLFVENCKFWRGGGGTPLPPIGLQGECSAAHDDCALNGLNYLQICAGIFVFGMWRLERRRATAHLTAAEFISASEGSSTTPHPRRLIEPDCAKDRLA